MKENAPVGWYKAACALIFSLAVLPHLSVQTIFPVMSKLYLFSREILEILIERTVKYLYLAGLPMALGTILLSDRIILLVYGEGFEKSGIILRILGIYLPIRLIYLAMSFAILAVNKEKLRAISLIIALLANILLNILLIPKFSFIGAAIATVITEVVLFASCSYFIAKDYFRIRSRLILLKTPFAGVIMGIFIYYFKDLNLVVLISSAAIIYAIVLYLLKSFDKQDMEIFKQLNPIKATKEEI